MENHDMITAEFYPAIPRTEIVAKSKYRFPLAEINSLGSGFAVVAAAIAKAAISAPTDEGLYRCVFPKGVKGHLAAFNDGSGLLGTIMNDSGIAGQARWIPAEGASAGLAVDPVTIVVAVAMMSINKKIDDIKEMQADILQFLHQDKESQLEGSVNALADIYMQYRYNSDNSIWKTAHLSTVTTIKSNVEGNIVFYRKEITNVFNKQKAVHGYQGADKLKAAIDKNMKYYQLSIYLSAYASFLEVILGGNYSKDYLEHMAETIRENAYQYKVDYTQCYEQLEGYMKGTIENVALSGIGKAGTIAGRALGKVPVLSKGPVDEALIYAGHKLKGIGSGHGKKAMRDFRSNSDAGIQLFVENIEAINRLSNSPVELLFDKQEIYICEPN